MRNQGLGFIPLFLALGLLPHPAPSQERADAPGAKAEWTWVSGSSAPNQAGIYGTQGVAAPTNIPGCRTQAVSFTDAKGNFWLFGGQGEDKFASDGWLSDLWKFDGMNWTRVSGAKTTNQIGTYGTEGTPSAQNVPGARYGSVAWIDVAGRLWLFGGRGNDSIGTQAPLNDLWRWGP